MGFFVRPTKLKILFRNGVKQYSAYNSPTKSLGTHIFGKKTIGYKVVQKNFMNCGKSKFFVHLDLALRHLAMGRPGEQVLPMEPASTRASQGSPRRRWGSGLGLAS